MKIGDLIQDKDDCDIGLIVDVRLPTRANHGTTHHILWAVRTTWWREGSGWYSTNYVKDHCKVIE